MPFILSSGYWPVGQAGRFEPKVFTAYMHIFSNVALCVRRCLAGRSPEVNLQEYDVNFGRSVCLAENRDQ
jgi:hypothetical protein